MMLWDPSFLVPSVISAVCEYTYRGDIGCTNGTEMHHSAVTVGCWKLDHQRSITHSQLSAVIHGIQETVACAFEE